VSMKLLAAKELLAELLNKAPAVLTLKVSGIIGTVGGTGAELLLEEL